MRTDGGSTYEAVRAAASEIRRKGRSRRWWHDRLVQRVNGPVQRRVRGADGVDVMAADWDTLVVLDACRADLFEAEADLDRYDEYDRVTSRASMTAEWARRNFGDGAFGDTVYVSANPVVNGTVPDRWHRLVDVWRDGFDDDAGTVRPETVVRAALDVHEEHPHKRLVVHFLQPHAPFLSDPDLRFQAFSTAGDGVDTDDRAKNVWEALRLGLVDRDRVLDGYRENFRAVDAALDDLLAAVDGRTVVTADHGNAYGEIGWPLPLRTYGHPPGLRQRCLVDVPSAAVTTGSRRVRDDGVRANRREGDDVREKLAALGYAE